MSSSRGEIGLGGVAPGAPVCRPLRRLVRGEGKKGQSRLSPSHSASREQWRPDLGESVAGPVEWIYEFFARTRGQRPAAS